MNGKTSIYYFKEQDQNICDTIIQKKGETVNTIGWTSR